MAAKFSVDQIGPLVSIQDAGRQGYMRYGVTGAGPMDRLSHTLANLAVGNEPPAATIEVSLGGFSLRCIEGEATLAIAGGCFNPVLDGTSMPPWSRFDMQAGSKLSIRPGPWGSWCYVAFAGSLVAPSWLGSQSIIQGITLCGTPLQLNDIINLDSSATTSASSRASGKITQLIDPAPLQPDSAIRIVAGPQDRYFNDESIHALHTAPFQLTADYNRMGIRLSGPALSINTELNMPSAPVTRGSMQVPGHGDPICLMADHQTTGGYPKIATIISADQDKLAQLRTGDTINFNLFTAAEAVLIARQRHEQLESIAQSMHANQVSLEDRLWAHNLIGGVISAQ